jgi:N-acetylglucosamine kinase-like BadF-type ATPase
VNQESPKTGESLVLGVDGGGTKTVAWLASRDEMLEEPPLGEGVAGPGNPRAVGFSAAQSEILRAVQLAFESAGEPVRSVAAACLALAGAGRAAEQEAILRWAASVGLAERVMVTDDAEPVLAAGVRERWGIALLCGTGSLAWGRNLRGEVGRVGGWGYLLGDEGSGYQLACQGLRAALRAADGRGEATSLMPLLLHELGAASPEQLVERVYGGPMPRRELAALAKVVLAAAEHDGPAQRIVEEGAAALAEMVAALVRRLALVPGDYPLAMAGGLLIHHGGYRERVLDELARRQVPPGTIALVHQPVRGAVALARELARGTLRWASAAKTPSPDTG